MRVGSMSSLHATETLIHMASATIGRTPIDNGPRGRQLSYYHIITPVIINPENHQGLDYVTRLSSDAVIDATGFVEELLLLYPQYRKGKFISELAPGSCKKRSRALSS